MTPSPKKTDDDPLEKAAAEAAALDAELAELSYEQARDELVGVVRRLESGAETLEESLALWERGEALARRCETWLAGAQAKLDARLPAEDD
ncbi:exodeoxyribonuclease VII small subunit [Kineosporia mesophila]|uniref:Exodeoxyribonuclease 7 small subunit n=1 Tax=Kineosporia mesophila TaxID=566012 RepID=A0ABP6YV73_9ACTN|nr:exodeoxyribonuclease VII small subunit [Kineosporia mesophila]